ncbi:aminotransferase class I/II-fold pyridoxal phosphate-dependent enzyme [Oscillochloris sp. ZM17-4]|uniref:DegT/DnrJ/EryC1/StrS family aminotransferase n=1 Tax=Oscillochloris sp. ZM17-4 TaxID=2866714 RepID=UPI001C738011|nr:aminotransferase class I/II-fold pyridoxal phosphate-dependent enzyme [Oscillochloris sp. ZM17-4]MBX0330769.1 aminotransferase class I/II-fold pyridoxal phosphate-dependent enzyme [Oscillochloris sp. ZM17-4]
MSIARVIRAVGRGQVRNLWYLANRLPLQAPSLTSMTLDADDLAVARRWLRHRTDWDACEPVARFEAAFAQWNGSAAAYAFMSGREALSACLTALDLRPGDEVAIPGYTCVVVPNALSYAGLTPIYADIEHETYGLDVTSLERRITPRTKAILLQHLFGLVCRDYEAILDVARRHGLPVIEDCAHATGAAYRGVNVGNYGDIAFYSLEQSKVLTTIQGGIATTNRADLAARLADIRDAAPLPDDTWIDRQLHQVALNYYRFKHPSRWWLGDLWYLRYGHTELISTTDGEIDGRRPPYYGRRMAAPIAALGMSQLAKVDAYNSRRRATAARWDAWCDAQGLAKPLVLPGSRPVYLRYPVLVRPEQKQDLRWAMRSLGVKPGVWFVSHRHPAPGVVAGCPQADEAVARCINLPCLA